MSLEIERKFLVTGDFSRQVTSAQRIVQGYICSQPGRTVRVRIRGRRIPHDQGRIGRERVEPLRVRTKIPLADAEELLKLCEPGAIDKVRNLVPAGKHTWEVDVFHGDNDGLVLAEIELESEDEPFGRPEWIGQEVSGDRRYYNSMLTKHPYREWKES